MFFHGAAFEPDRGRRRFIGGARPAAGLRLARTEDGVEGKGDGGSGGVEDEDAHFEAVVMAVFDLSRRVFLEAAAVEELLPRRQVRPDEPLGAGRHLGRSEGTAKEE